MEPNNTHQDLKGSTEESTDNAQRGETVIQNQHSNTHLKAVTIASSPGSMRLKRERTPSSDDGQEVEGIPLVAMPELLLSSPSQDTNAVSSPDGQFVQHKEVHNDTTSKINYLAEKVIDRASSLLDLDIDTDTPIVIVPVIADGLKYTHCIAQNDIETLINDHLAVFEEHYREKIEQGVKFFTLDHYNVQQCRARSRGRQMCGVSGCQQVPSDMMDHVKRAHCFEYNDTRCPKLSCRAQFDNLNNLLDHIDNTGDHGPDYLPYYLYEDKLPICMDYEYKVTAIKQLAKMTKIIHTNRERVVQEVFLDPETEKIPGFEIVPEPAVSNH